MKKILVAIFSLITSLQVSYAQPNVELKIVYEPTACGLPCFQAYMRPTEPYTAPVQIGGSQITVRFPTSINSSGSYFFISQGAGGSWGIIQGNIACDADWCYHQIATSGSPYNSDIAAGEEVHLFSIVIAPSGSCVDSVRLHETGVDPTDPANTGSNVEINFFIVGPGEVYLGNYQNDPIDCLALPVEFIAFEAKKIGLTKAKLDWATGSEEANDYFAVQRGRNPYSWETIGVVPGAGYSPRRNDYVFYDNNPFIGRNYYRIIQVDFDGSEKGTNIREVSFTEAPEVGEINIYPNPSSTGLHVQFPIQALENPTVMTLYDNTGRVVFSRDLSEETDYEYINYTKSNITTGAYLLQIGNEDTVIDRQKVIVQRTQ